MNALLEGRLKLPAPWTIIFGSETIAFPLTGSAADAVTRLKGIVHPTFLHAMLSPSVVGSVSENRVGVRFQRPWFHNGLAPVFVGSFTVVAGRRTLAGEFRLTRFAQVWLAVWFGFLLAANLFTVIAMLSGAAQPGAKVGLLIMLLMWAGGLGLVYFSWWMGRRDRIEIERRLRQALSSSAA
jgi:hypothetical protein